MKSIFEYQQFIAQMPLLEQSFTSKRSTWKGKIDEQKLEMLFKEADTIKISRDEIFHINPIERFILKVILWGYPRGMMGNKNDKLIFKQLDEIAEIVNKPSRAKATETDLNEVLKELLAIKGLGISTISKLLYFRTHQFGDYKALILDERIMRVFNDKIFIEFDEIGKIRPDNAAKKYLDYLKMMHDIAKKMKVQAEKIEMFLFTFGNNLS